MNILNKTVRSAGLVALLMVVGTLVAAPTTHPATKRVTVGEKFPEVSVRTLDGKVVSVSEAKGEGKLVFVMLRGWVGYQCPVCTQQVGELVGAAAKLEAAGAKVMLVYPGAAKDVEKRAKEFMANKDVPASWVFGVDEDLKVVEELGLRWDAKNETAYPATYVIGQNGVVVFAKISKSHGGRASAAEVLGALAK